MTQRRLPTREDLLWPTLKALEARGGSASIQELSEQVASDLELSDEVSEVPHKNGPKSEVDYRAAWARTYLKFVGAVDNRTRGVWTITEFGRRIRTEEEVRELIRQDRTQRYQERRGRNAEAEEDMSLPEDETDGKDVTLPKDPQVLAEELFLTDPGDFLHGIDTLLADKKQVVFQGPPGTGKTYVARKLANHLAGSEARVTLVQFHPSYAYEDFVQGFRPASVNGQPGFELEDGPLLQAAKRAREEPDEKHFLVIDEINRGNLAKVFGELYFLLEYRDEKIRLQYQREGFSLPDNLYIIGTMNTADRSIALVDLALRRRFYFVEFHPDSEPIKGVLRRWLKVKAPGMEWVADVVERANERLGADRHAAIGPSYFMKDGLDEDAVERIAHMEAQRPPLYRGAPVRGERPPRQVRPR